jgi:F-type H+-transporting ATPase subunit delta
MASPTLTSEEKSQKLVEVCEGELNQGQQNFLRNLADYDRLPLLAEISALFELYKANQEKSVDVNIETAFELSAAQSSELEACLKKTLARDVELSASVNKELLGGVFIRAGDTVIDASIRGRLQKLASAMSA